MTRNHSIAIPSGFAKSVHGGPLSTFPEGRICAWPGCKTPLSIYNPVKYCSPHEQEANKPGTKQPRKPKKPDPEPEPQPRPARPRPRVVLPAAAYGPPTNPKHLSSNRVCEIVGITYRQLDYWSRSGLIEGQPKSVGSGSQRTWTWMQVNRVRELAWFKEDIHAQCERMGVIDEFTVKGRQR